MSKPFQFSMRRMFVSVGFFCVAAALFAAMPRASDGALNLAEFLGGSAALGAAVGAIFGRPLVGAASALAAVGIVAGFG